MTKPVVLFLAIALTTSILYTIFHKKCLQSHNAIGYQPGWMQMIHSGDVWIPVWHEPYYYNYNACDKYEE